eukprot:gb/GECG01015062.1/.p1 GENE.gb/GECG01015062.1/~~gb/GECG01015062.1/.p1  ORF type:complete len:102 (+),score=5.02 gb/GECG01015062.1/:1-306(+)
MDVTQVETMPHIRAVPSHHRHRKPLLILCECSVLSALLLTLSLHHSARTQYDLLVVSGADMPVEKKGGVCEIFLQQSKSEISRTHRKVSSVNRQIDGSIFH